MVRVVGLGELLCCEVASLIDYSKHVTERPKKPPVRRPIRNGEYRIAEGSVKLVLEGLSKVAGCALDIVAESSTAPCSENKHRMSVSMSNGQYTMYPPSKNDLQPPVDRWRGHMERRMLGSSVAKDVQVWLRYRYERPEY